MFRISEIVPESEFREIIEHLQKKPIAPNYFRKTSGVGRSQCFGLVKCRNGRYCGSRMNYLRPELYGAIQILARKILPPEFHYDGIQINVNYQTKPHKDSNNRGESAIIGFGEYEGGELMIEETPVSIKRRLVYFDGSIYTHSTAPFTGTRYSLVFFSVNQDFIEVPRYTTVTTNKGIMISEEMEGVERIFTQDGTVFWSSDGSRPQKVRSRPILRAAIE